MPVVAYLTNQFPSAVEPYVVDEIRELRRRGVTVIPCSARLSSAGPGGEMGRLTDETLYLQTMRFALMVRAVVVFLLKLPLLLGFLRRALLQGNESPARRWRALLHTCLGVYYAVLIKKNDVEHIHVHHGYFACWIAMVAARVLGIEFSMTLHGSDLLVNAAYLDTKLQHCKFCVTVSEFNRRHILERYPHVVSEKIVVRRMGVDPCTRYVVPRVPREPTQLVMLAVGRLHAVKHHAFLIQACRVLKDHRVSFACRIAGEGPERASLERLIHNLHVDDQVQLLGHLPHSQIEACYTTSDLIVLTSHSEGIPLVLMEAMSQRKAVLAPAITGIPELVVDGKTGFLYRTGSMEDFVGQVELIQNSLSALGPLRRAAREHVVKFFNRENNLAAFCDFFLTHINQNAEDRPHENPVLQ